MRKLVQVVDKERGICKVALHPEKENEYLRKGFIWAECEDSYDGVTYLEGYAPSAPEPTYAEQREDAYPALEEQLDMLFHDIENGLLGAKAKTSMFYLALKEVKETYPKPGVAEDAAEETPESAGSDEG